LMYATSKNFMDHFGLSSVKDLPKLKDIQSIETNEIGIPAEMVDDSYEADSTIDVENAGNELTPDSETSES